MKKLLTISALIILIIAIIVGVLRWLNPYQQGSIFPEQPGTDEPAAEAPWCPAVELISVPGSGESSSDDDPFNPTANPNALLLNVTGPLSQEYDEKTLRVWTVPYPSQLRNPTNEDEMGLDESRDIGTEVVNSELSYVAGECPNTRFMMMGFSQGAIIAGDVAANIGQGRGPISPDRVISTALVADSRRDHDSGVDVSDPVAPGEGIEIALKPYARIAERVTPGSTLRGPRPGGFGELNDRTFNICGVNDTVCDIEDTSISGLMRLGDGAFISQVHVSYRDNTNVLPGGVTVPQWLLQWVRNEV